PGDAVAHAAEGDQAVLPHLAELLVPAEEGLGRQRQQGRALCLEARERRFLRRAVDPLLPLALKGDQLFLEVRPVPPGALAQKELLQVAEGILHLAFALRMPRRTGDRLEAVVSGEALEVRV